MYSRRSFRAPAQAQRSGLRGKRRYSAGRELSPQAEANGPEPVSTDAPSQPQQKAEGFPELIGCTSLMVLHKTQLPRQPRLAGKFFIFSYVLTGFSSSALARSSVSSDSS